MQTISVSDLATRLEVPAAIVRRFVLSHGFAQQRYPRQRLSVPLARVEELRAAMEREGFRLPVTAA